MITIDTLKQLREREPEILERLAARPRGGELFLYHPLRCLEDLGYRLAPEVRGELLERMPALRHRSPAAYHAIASSPPRGSRVRVRGLFGGRR